MRQFCADQERATLAIGPSCRCRRVWTTHWRTCARAHGSERVIYAARKRTIDDNEDVTGKFFIVGIGWLGLRRLRVVLVGGRHAPAHCRGDVKIRLADCTVSTFSPRRTGARLGLRQKVIDLVLSVTSCFEAGPGKLRRTLIPAPAYRVPGPLERVNGS